MIRLLVVLAIIVVLLTSAVFAQELDGTVTLYADAAGTDCNIVAPTSGLFYIFVFFVNASQPATAIGFSAPMPACLQATFIGDYSPFSTAGGSQNGIAVWWGYCMESPTHVHLLTMTYLAVGPTDPCCHYPVGPDPVSGVISVTGCGLYPESYTAGEDQAIINQDASCPCTFPVPVEATTWGAIKAQYN